MKIGRLGRTGRSPMDRRQLWLGRYLAPEMYSAPPPFDDWSGSIRYRPFMNDQLGCCTITALAHIIQQRCALRGIVCTITDADIVDAYKLATGYDGTPATDRGGQMYSALRVAQKHGIGGHKLGPYLALNMRDGDELRAALHSFGSIYVGGNLPRRISDQGTEWFIPQIPGEADRPSSLGGHAWALTGFDHVGWWSVPWTDIVGFRNDWQDTYTDEGYVFFDDLWARRDLVAPNGFDYDRLMHDFAALAA